MSSAGRRDDRRWRLQHELMQTDVVSGIDRRVLDVIGNHPASAHRVVTADGTRLSYKRFGDGPRTVVFCNGLGGTYRTFADVIARLLPDHTVLCWDYRGLFESGAPLDRDAITIEHHAADLFAVMDDVGVDTATVFGWSMGVQVALEAFRQDRTRIDAVVLASGVDGRILETVFDMPGSRAVVPAAIGALRRYGGLVTPWLAGAVQSPRMVRVARALNLVGRNADVTLEHAALLLSTDPEVYFRAVDALHAHDASDIVDQLDVPVLILHGDRDMLTPVSSGRDLRTRIADAEIWVFAGCTHAVVLEFPERVSRHLLDFLRRRVYGP